MLLMKFLQTKAKIKSMDTISYDVCWTVSKNKNENEVKKYFKKMKLILTLLMVM